MTRFLNGLGFLMILLAIGGALGLIVVLFLVARTWTTPLLLACGLGGLLLFVLMLGGLFLAGVARRDQEAGESPGSSGPSAGG